MFFRKASARRKAKRQQQFQHAAIEGLEQRRMLSVSPFSAGMLTYDARLVGVDYHDLGWFTSDQSASTIPYPPYERTLINRLIGGESGGGQFIQSDSPEYWDPPEPGDWYVWSVNDQQTLYAPTDLEVNDGDELPILTGSTINMSWTNNATEAMVFVVSIAPSSGPYSDDWWHVASVEREDQWGPVPDVFSGEFTAPDQPGEYTLRVWAYGTDPNWNARSPETATTITVVPEVSIVKEQDGSEDPGDNYPTDPTEETRPMKFRVSRTGATYEALDVYLGTGGGTAQENVDYQTLPTLVTIPIGDSDAVFSVTPIDDVEVEDEETVEVPLAASPTALYALALDPQATTAEATTRDNDYWITGGYLYFDSQTILMDGSTVAYGASWQDRNGDGDADDDTEVVDPLSFMRSTATTPNYIGVDVDFRADNLPEGEYQIIGLGSDIGDPNFQGEATVSDGHLIASVLSTDALPDTIDYGTLDIDWTVVRTVRTKEWEKEYGTSSNLTYVTGGPAPSEYETVLDVGCQAAAGQAPDNADNAIAAANSIWAKFESRAIRTVNDRLLKYYGAGYDTAVDGDTGPLLLNADGRCGNWTHFLVRTFYSQGLLAFGQFGAIKVEPEAWVVPPPDPAWGAGWGAGLKVIDVKAIPAQGNAQPVDKFKDHALFAWVPKAGVIHLYDASYGVRKIGATPAAVYGPWEDDALEQKAFAYERAGQINYNYEPATASLDLKYTPM